MVCAREAGPDGASLARRSGANDSSATSSQRRSNPLRRQSMHDNDRSIHPVRPPRSAGREPRTRTPVSPGRHDSPWSPPGPRHGEESAGRYRVVIDEAWTVVYVHGGVVAAVAARMAEHAGPDEPMRVTGVGALYLRPLAAGPIDGVVSRLRVGRGAAQASVDLSGPDGELAVRVTVVLASPRNDGVEAPSMPRPQDALDVGPEELDARSRLAA